MPARDWVLVSAANPTIVDEETLRKVSRFINERTGGFLENLLVTQFHLCPECLSHLVKKDEVTSCSHCGLVVHNGHNVKNPFWIGDEHNPVNQLSFGRDQGGSLQLKGLWSVLATQSEAKTEDLPLRARQISIITNRLEHPKLEQMLRLGSQLCNECGFDQHGEPKSVQFSNLLGRIIRTVGAYVILYNERTSVSKLTKACLLVAFRYSKIRQSPTPESLGVSPTLFQAVWKLYESLRPIRRGH